MAPTLTRLFAKIPPRLHGLSLVGVSVLGMVLMPDPGIKLILAYGLAMAALVAFVMRDPSPGRLPALGPGHPIEGSVMIGHEGKARMGGAVSVPWRRFRHGLVVEGTGDARSEFVAGIALQAVAAGRPVILLDLGGGYGLAEPFLHAANDAHLADDVWTFGGADPSVRLDLFDGVPPDLLSRLVSEACRCLDGPESNAVLARLLLPAAQAMFEAVTDGLAEQPRERTVGAFEDCLGLAALEGFLERADIAVERTEPGARGEVARYLLAIPGYAPGAKQPSSVTAAHAAAANVLKDGLGVLRRICDGSAPPVGPRDLVAPGRACVFRRHLGAASWQEAGAVIDVVAEEIRSSARLMPLVVVDGIDTLPGDLAARIVGLRACGATLVAGCDGGRPVPGLADRPGDGTARIALSQAMDGTAWLQSPSGRLRKFHALPLDHSRALPSKPEPGTRFVRVADVPADSDRTLAYLTVLSGLLEMPDTPAEPPAFDPSPILDRYARRVTSLGDQSLDRIAAHVLAGEPAMADMDPAPTADAPEGDTGRAADNDAEPDFDLDLDFGLGPLFDPDGKDAGLDLDGAFPGLSPKSDGGRVVFPATIRDDPGLAQGPWHRVAGAPLPMTPTVPPREVATLLDEEFPHFAAATARATRLLAGSARVPARPILLHGARGIGKTRYARRLCELMHRRWSLYPCGSSPDASFVGASRQWSGARPGYAATQAARHRSCDPAIILDAVDAVPQGPNHAAFFSGVTALLDAETSPRYHDPYLDAQIDLSRVAWIATATEIDRLPDGFGDLFEVIALPTPGEADLFALVMALVLESPARDPVDFQEASEVAESVGGRWKGGSVRVLGSLVAEAMAERKDRLVKVGG